MQIRINSERASPFVPVAEWLPRDSYSLRIILWFYGRNVKVRGSTPRGNILFAFCHHNHNSLVALGRFFLIELMVRLAFLSF